MFNIFTKYLKEVENATLNDYTPCNQFGLHNCKIFNFVKAFEFD